MLLAVITSMFKKILYMCKFVNINFVYVKEYLFEFVINDPLKISCVRVLNGSTVLK